MEQQKDEGTPFNMAMLFYMEIHKLREKKILAMLENNFILAYDSIEELYTLISWKLKKPEKEEVVIKLKEVKEKLQQAYKEEEEDYILLGEAKDLLRIIDRDILYYMSKYNMLFPKIKTSGGFGSLISQFDLKNENS